jgi:hypothetical protein
VPENLKMLSGYSACLACMISWIKCFTLQKKIGVIGLWWLTPVILATQEAEIKRITVQSQLGQIVHEVLS